MTARCLGKASHVTLREVLRVPALMRATAPHRATIITAAAFQDRRGPDEIINFSAPSDSGISFTKLPHKITLLETRLTSYVDTLPVITPRNNDTTIITAAACVSQPRSKTSQNRTDAYCGIRWRLPTARIRSLRPHRR